jgi:flavorubredoxin
MSGDSDPGSRISGSTQRRLFLVRDEEPLLFHTGMRRMFPDVHDAVARVLDASSIRWISWSHFEVDECGARNDWLAIAPRAQAACSQVGSTRRTSPSAHRGSDRGEVVETGSHRFRFIPTPHLPHGWDAGVLFEESSRLLLCADLFHQVGDREPMTTDDVVGRWGHAMELHQAHPVLKQTREILTATSAARLRR